MKPIFSFALLVLAAVAVGCAEHRQERAEFEREPAVPSIDIPAESPPPPATRRVPVEEPPPPPEPDASAPPPEDPSPNPAREIADTGPATPADGPVETIMTDSGLIIEVLKRSDGETVQPADTIVIHYHGTLANGRIFDSSVDRGEPATLNLFQTIQGWQEGIPGMKVGGKRRLIVPADLGYGPVARPNIPANSMLIFEVELLDIIR